VAVVARSEWFTAAGSLAAGVARALLPDRPDDLWNGPLALVPLQVLAWELAIRAGEDPDAPANLSKVVRLEGREAPAVETTES
jgi:glucosamine 6-phosphate synthetase-like amidotransferase/phosphosugar isomerase protein